MKIEVLTGVFLICHSQLSMARIFVLVKIDASYTVNKIDTICHYYAKQLKPLV